MYRDGSGLHNMSCKINEDDKIMLPKEQSNVSANDDVSLGGVSSRRGTALKKEALDI
ncbi:hypothetical protein HPP92_006505 [Vanilla planifolia]|uniref:Uncharacterized protein n=1 Tax=Vanilla planifolia TaxID=51239 RepID=A0A835RW21_VANPL|nr:hypothetical protein HPP92_006505 [Vanilla planifolia]